MMSARGASAGAGRGPARPAFGTGPPAGGVRGLGPEGPEGPAAPFAGEIRGPGAGGPAAPFAEGIRGLGAGGVLPLGPEESLGEGTLLVYHGQCCTDGAACLALAVLAGLPLGRSIGIPAGPDGQGPVLAALAEMAPGGRLVYADVAPSEEVIAAAGARGVPLLVLDHHASEERRLDEAAAAGRLGFVCGDSARHCAGCVLVAAWLEAPLAARAPGLSRDVLRAIAFKDTTGLPTAASIAADGAAAAGRPARGGGPPADPGALARLLCAAEADLAAAAGGAVEEARRRHEIARRLLVEGFAAVAGGTVFVDAAAAPPGEAYSVIGQLYRLLAGVTPEGAPPGAPPGFVPPAGTPAEALAQRAAEAAGDGGPPLRLALFTVEGRGARSTAKLSLRGAGALELALALNPGAGGHAMAAGASVPLARLTELLAAGAASEPHYFDGAPLRRAGAPPGGPAA